MKSFISAVAAVLIGATASIAAPLAARAAGAPINSCTHSTGTIIAVDFSHWSGPIVRGCDLTKPSSGITLLNDAGFRTTGTQHDGPQFLCRIGNQAYDSGTQYPTPNDESCVQTPPASAYWSYWLAPKGQNTWSYSQYGAYSDKPLEGEVELWMFGGTDITGGNGDPINGFPVCTPNSLRAGGSATTCTPTGSKAGKGIDHYRPRAKASRSKAAIARSKHQNPRGSAHQAAPGTSHAAGSAPIGSATGARPGSSAGTRPSPSATASRASAKAAHDSAPAASSGAEGSEIDVAQAGNIVAAKPASTKAPSAGSAVPLVIGIGLALLLAVGGGFTMWRRRQVE